MPKASFTRLSRPAAYEIRDSPIHGTGVFAARAIRRGERILEYLGELIDKEESERRALRLLEHAKRNGGGAVYIFTLDEDWDLDGAVTWNDARLVNHSCDPNTQVWDVDGRLWIEALRAIRKGEELTYNYGFDLDSWQDHPCRCGSPRCVGYIVNEDDWPALRRAIARRDRARQPQRESPGRAPSQVNGGRRTAPTP